MTEVTHHTPEEIAEQVRQLTGQLQMAGRKDLLLKAIGRCWKSCAARRQGPS